MRRPEAFDDGRRRSSGSVLPAHRRRHCTRVFIRDSANARLELPKHESSRPLLAELKG